MKKTVETITYEVFIKDVDTQRTLPTGNYLIRHAATDTYMTCNGLQQPVTFTDSCGQSVGHWCYAKWQWGNGK